jgi:hypothetical protein
MVSMKRFLLGALALLLPSLAQAQGTLPLALTQQFSFTNCATFTNACGTPVALDQIKRQGDDRPVRPVDYRLEDKRTAADNGGYTDEELAF